MAQSHSTLALAKERRSGVAIATLTNLTSKTISAGTPFALRAHGGSGSTGWSRGAARAAS